MEMLITMHWRDFYPREGSWASLLLTKVPGTVCCVGGLTGTTYIVLTWDFFSKRLKPWSISITCCVQKCIYYCNSNRGKWRGPTGAVVLVTVVGAVQKAVTPLTVQHACFTIRTASPVHTGQRPMGGWTDTGGETQRKKWFREKKSRFI